MPISKAARLPILQKKGLTHIMRSAFRNEPAYPLKIAMADFKSIRQNLTEIIQQAPAEKLAESMIVPWGGKSTVSEFLEIFSRHEEEHTADLLCWLEDHEKNILDLKK